MLIADDVKRAFAGQNWAPDESAYLDVHAGRIAYTVNLIQEYHSIFNIRTVLDIGASFLTTSIKKFIKPEVSISTLGWTHARLVPPGVVDRHIHCDLNDCADQPLHATERLDMIVFAETYRAFTYFPDTGAQFFEKPPKTGGRCFDHPNPQRRIIFKAAGNGKR